MGNDSRETDFSLVLDRRNLYREESFTDMKVGAVRRLTPVTADGAADDTRSPIYYGHTQLMSPEGPLPVSCTIEAGSLPEAISRFPEAMRREIEGLLDQLQQAQEQSRKQESRIVTL